MTGTHLPGGKPRNMDARIGSLRAVLMFRATLLGLALPERAGPAGQPFRRSRRGGSTGTTYGCRLDLPNGWALSSGRALF